MGTFPHSSIQFLKGHLNLGHTWAADLPNFYTSVCSVGKNRLILARF